MGSTELGVLLAPALFLSGALGALLLASRPAAARWASALLGACGGVAGAAAALPILLGQPEVRAELLHSTPFTSITFRLDALAAWFVLLTSSVAGAVSVAAVGYARA
jgi:hydrogenase-4 component B